MMWHFRLDHPNFRYLKHLFPSLFTNKDARSFHCDICQLLKHTRSNYSPIPHKSSHPFSLIHGDIRGPTKIPNVIGAQWFLLLVDDHTRLSGTFLMKEKSETSQIFKNFHVMVRTQFQMSIQVLKTSVSNGVSKARLKARRAKIASRRWRNGLIHKKLAPS